MDREWFLSLWQSVRQSRAMNSSFMIGGLTVTALLLAEYYIRIRLSSVAIGYSVYWIIIVAALWHVSTLQWPRFHRDEDRYLVSLFLTGALVGFVVALGKLLLHRELWTVFNMLAEPLRTALVALLLAWLIVVRERTPRTLPS